MRLAAATFAFVLACASGAGVTQLRGSILYRERIALPPDAVVRVTLADVSLIDVPERVITGIEILPAGRQVPIYFALAVPDRDIDPARSYALRAQILDADGRLLWASTERVAVLTRGAPNEATLLLRRVAPAPDPEPGTPTPP